ncbi:ester cyclase [Haloferax larsenii]|uniref:Ester cyclase n=1 Tax=Haloferax larsenii TaxID=302484 RepID=A0ABY5REG0_HALLR|nr:ester cyclase [Haloferax larsenii]UVE50544.1 ester cyclase [Haloferax larsenii]
MATTEAEKKDVVHRLHSEIWSEGNLDLVDEIVAADYVEHNPTVPHDARGPADYKESVEMFRTAFPDLTLTEADTIVEGDKVVSRVTLQGTHEGEFMGVEPTGVEVESEGIVINRIVDNQLVESWPLADMMGVMQQLGVVESPAD